VQRENGGLASGVVDARWRVREGSVQNVVITGNTTGDAALASCVVRTVGAWDYGALTCDDARFSWRMLPSDDAAPSTGGAANPEDATPDACVASAQRHAAQVGACVRALFTRDPDASGALRVAWSVDEGEVSPVTVLENQTGDDAFAECVVARVVAWDFGGASCDVPSYTWNVHAP
jgi:hypothetical protein